MTNRRHHFDFLVMGSGVAGLSYALKVAEHGSVAVVTKKNSVEWHTNYAPGGAAAVLDGYDSLDSHSAGTLDAGAGLWCGAGVRAVVEGGPARARGMRRWAGLWWRKGRSASES